MNRTNVVRAAVTGNLAKGPHTDVLALVGQLFRRQPDEFNHESLYRVLRDGMHQARLTATTRLPPSRALAQALGIARNTVVQVYAQLALEGYVVSQVGRGTFVADMVPLVKPQVPAAAVAPATRRALLSSRGGRLIDDAGAAALQWGAFTPGVPEVRLFPAQVWTRLQNRLWRKLTPPQMSYASGGGDAGLRYAISEHLRHSRGLQCTPEQVVVTSGTQQSLHLVSQLLADPGDTVWLEDPGYWGARSVFQAQGLAVEPVAVDDEGLAPTDKQWLSPPRAMFVSPAHQYPLGVLMSQRRRRKLLDYAALRGVWVIEDDYDSEIRHRARPMPSLQGQDSHGRVIYLGTFSKTLFPALRLAYLVVPTALVAAFGQALNELYREGHTPLQVVLARFMSEGHYASHLRRMRAVYRARHDALLDAIAQHFGKSLPIWGRDAGLHLVLGLPAAVDDQALAARIAQAGVASRPLSLYHLRRPAPAGGLVLGYGGVDEADIARHFATLAQATEGWL